LDNSFGGRPIFGSVYDSLEQDARAGDTQATCPSSNKGTATAWMGFFMMELPEFSNT
jgi:hypothetical protein